MKKLNYFFSLFLLAIMLSFSANAQEKTVEYPDSWGKQGFQLESSKSTGLTVNYSIKKFMFSSPKDVEGEQMQEVTLPGIFLPNEEGMPNLPGNGRYIAIPEGAKPILKISSSRIETYENISIAPAAYIPLDTEKDKPCKKNQDVYSKNAFYPANPAILSPVTQMRGVDVAVLNIIPFQYNPVTKQLKVYRDLKVDVIFEGGKGKFGEDRLRNKMWDGILNQMLLNHKDLPKVDYGKALRASKGKDNEGCEYLIVVPNNPEFKQWADTLKKFRTEQGIKTKVVSLEEIGGNELETIKTYLHNAYNNWSPAPASVLLMADFGSDASNSITAKSYPHPSGSSPYVPDDYITDNYYADVNGDFLPDMNFARMTGRNAAELEIMVKKVLINERTPSTSEDFYNHPVTALGWQHERWFQICSEAVYGFFESIGKEPVRENALYKPTESTSTWSSAQNTQTVLDFFGQDGLGYLPTTPTHLTDWGGNATRVNNDLNSGAFLLQHRDHGMQTGWGEPSYTNANIDALNNTDLPFIFSNNCLTGMFNHTSECFAEKFHRYSKNGEPSGALGMVAATQVSYSFVNDTYVWGVYDNMWPQFMPETGAAPSEENFVRPGFANVAGKFFLSTSNWPYNTGSKEITYNLFHLHGDAYTTLYTEIPQNLTVDCNPVLIGGLSKIEVTANVGAQIAITKGGEIIGLGTGTGSVVNIDIAPQIPGQKILVTITKQNYYRYSKKVDVIPANGPYVVRNTYTVNDAAANNNSLLEFGETALINMSVKNIGSEDASSVTTTITTEDEFVTVLDAEHTYGNVAVDASVDGADAYKLTATNNIPDGHSINFKVISTNGTDNWESTLSIPVKAPKMKIGEFVIDDSEGNNNGVIERGETAKVKITIKNIGHAKVENVTTALSTEATGITIAQAEVSTTSIDIEGSVEVEYTVTADANISPETKVILKIETVGSTHYTAEKEVETLIGPVYCAAIGAGSYEHISHVEFEDIDNTSENSDYTNYTDITTNVSTGESYPIKVTNGKPYSSDKCVAWADWNQDGDFEDAGEEYVIGTGKGPYENDIVVPADALSGNTRLRIRVFDTSSSSGSSTSCGDAKYGEVEDYTLVVSSANEAKFYTFKIKDLDVTTQIDAATKTVIVTVPYGTDITNLTPMFTATSQATVKVGATAQISGETTHNFSNPIVYKVTSEDGTVTTDWTVKVVIGKNTEAKVVSFTFKSENNQQLTEDITGTIDGNNISVTIPENVNYCNLIATYELSYGANAKVGEVEQVSGTTVNVFEEDVIYTIIAEDETTNQTWTVKRTGGYNSISDMQEMNIEIYPVPAKTYFTIKTVKKSEIKIYSLRGKLMETIKTNGGSDKINTTKYSAGTYIVKIMQDGKIATQRIEIIK